MYKHLSKMTKLSCIDARKKKLSRARHVKMCTISQLLKILSEVQSPLRMNLHSTRIKYLKFTICCNLNTHSSMHPIVKINMLFASWEARIEKTCGRGLEISARGRRSRAAFSRPISHFCAIRTDPLLVNIFFFFSLSPILS